MAQVKLVAESFESYINQEDSLLEGELNEGLAKKWQKVNKDDVKVLKAFAGKIKARTQGPKGLEILKKRLVSAKPEKLKGELEKAAKVDFKGNWVLIGDDFAFKPLKAQKLKSATQHSQTNTGQGGN